MEGGGVRLASLRELTLTRLRVMLREPEVVFWVFLFPVLLAVGLGVAFSDPAPERLTVAVVREGDGDTEGGSGEVGSEPLRIPGGMPAPGPHPVPGGATLEFVSMGREAADAALLRGEVALVLLTRGDSVVHRYDPARADGRLARLALEALTGGGGEGSGAPPPARDEEARERGGRYIDWLIPGLIGFNLMSTGLWSVGFYLTQMRSTRQLKRLVATPMRRSDFLLAQMLARLIFLVAEVPLLVLFAWLAFGVTVEGGLGSLAAVTLVGGGAFAGLGLLAASRTRTTEAVSGIINVMVMPMVVLSGVFFSTSRFPDALQPFIRALPLTPLNDALRAVYNDGASVAAVAGELLIVAAWGAGAFLLALRWFRWQ